MTEVVAGHKDQQKEILILVEALPNRGKIMVRTIDGN